ncbi:AraC family transcriptional regulator [Dokdonia pacifica]|uniref:AraC-type DNA-binding protein n=1 Tax=Dokdonia pacifica TaxID=1627892 RepID=A0A239BMS2_9FLAO|nr:AraC family transcriptional regulator [Dokdonia pacifica]GGG28502.1 AraC family transcriptional regulator [Dokdonia pacifica]SNS09280.1 AraC-type DNA-binding protein [Dokdonia pacifica]
MLQFDFLKNKYGKELLIDLGRIERLHGYILEDTLHYITFYEVLVITDGKGTFSLDGEIKELRRGTVIVALPNQVRQWNVKGAVKGFAFFFEGEFLNTHFKDKFFLNRFSIFDYDRPRIGYDLEEEHIQKLLWSFEEVEKEFLELEGDSSHIFRSLLYFVISQIDRYYRKNVGQQNEEAPLHIYQFKKLLDKNIYQWQTVQEYVSAMQISKDHLNNLIQGYFKQTPLQIIHRRIELIAKREIQYSDKTMSEISHELNFSDVSNFNRFFKKRTGLTPKSFRVKMTR